MYIKETKEAFIGVNELSLFLIERLKDGVGIDDAIALFQALTTDEEFKAKLGAAVEGISLVPGELKDLDVSEGMELAVIAISYVPKYVEAFKTEVAEAEEAPVVE